MRARLRVRARACVCVRARVRACAWGCVSVRACVRVRAWGRYHRLPDRRGWDCTEADGGCCGRPGRLCRRVVSRVGGSGPRRIGARAARAKFQACGWVTRFYGYGVRVLETEHEAVHTQAHNGPSCPEVGPCRASTGRRCIRPHPPWPATSATYLRLVRQSAQWVRIRRYRPYKATRQHAECSTHVGVLVCEYDCGPQLASSAA